jgi:hypothetical protein
LHAKNLVTNSYLKKFMSDLTPEFSSLILLF